MENLLQLSLHEFDSIIGHLLPENTWKEQAVFAYAINTGGENKSLKLELVETDFIDPIDFVCHSEMHIDLSGIKRAQIIRRAHELNASIVEWHSHPRFWPVMFSKSDMVGLAEFVPHVMWRLEGRPYIALVVTPYDFDALIWKGAPDTPHQLGCLEIGFRKLYPTGATLKNQRALYGQQIRS